jgi:hypothetical protein
VTVILDWKTADETVPDPPARCTICDDDIHPPFAHWWCAHGSILICATCCRECRHGLAADMTRTAAIDEGLNPPPDCPTLRVTQ